nr:MAG TPA: autophagocytosis associated protein [Caudoviricetes sp.]
MVGTFLIYIGWLWLYLIIFLKLVVAIGNTQP